MTPLNYTCECALECVKMKVVQTVADKTLALQTRKREQRELGARIDRALAGSDEPLEADTVGCGGAICRRFARRLGARARVPRAEQTSTELGSIAVRDKAHARIFGAPKQSPASKLEAATDALRNRVASLESRSRQHMQAVRENLQAKRKDAAARELKKAKACDKQAASSRAVLDAMEAQADMMEQNALQREVAQALAGTAKTMKRDKKLLGKAEDAVDNAAEMRDLHDELGQIMAGLGDNAPEFDEDELQAELDAIAQEDVVPVAAPVDSSLADEMMRTAEALEKKHADYAEADRVRATLPKTPGKRGVEKQGLLSHA